MSDIDADLSDATIADIERDPWFVSDAEITSLVAELRRRRAADLTAADREVLRSARDMIYDCMPCGSEREVALLDRLIGGDRG